ncbi:MAG: energy transducer TonB [Bacteroidales bacterium]|nr:energy transducer TonB [Bacteroidales bacterium]
MKAKSSNKANLEKKRFLFFQAGMALSLAAVLAAFEWATPDTGDFGVSARGDWMIIEESIPVTVQRMERPAPPPMQRSETVLNVVADDQEDDDVVINIENDDDVINLDTSWFEPWVEPEPDDDNDMIFSVVEEMPEFVGGLPALMKFLGDNVKYPGDARQAGISGKVYVGFVVFKDGKIGNVTLKRGIGGGCDEEAVRVIRNMPAWKPGKQREVPVNVEFVIPIVFQLKNF